LEKYKISQESLVGSRLSFLKNKAQSTKNKVGIACGDGLQKGKNKVQSTKNKVGIACGDGLQKCMDIKNGAEAPSLFILYALCSII
jgi:hypothetical protein